MRIPDRQNAVEWRFLAVRRTLLIIALLAFWAGEGMVLFASGNAVMAWGISLIAGALILLLLVGGPIARLAGFAAGILALTVASQYVDQVVAWAFTARLLVMAPPVLGMIAFARNAFWAIERDETRLLIERRHG